MNNNANNLKTGLDNLVDINDEFARKEYRGASDYYKLLIATASVVYAFDRTVVDVLPINNLYKALINFLIFIACMGYTFYNVKIDIKKQKEFNEKQENMLEAKQLYDKISELIDKGDIESINEIKRLSVKYAYSDVKIVITDMGVIDNKNRFQVIVDYENYKNKILAYEQ